MSTADECVDALKLGLNGVPPAFAETLQSLKGYAFQAFAFDALGNYLCESSEWRWDRPEGVPTFARSSGETFESVTSALSCCRHNSDRHFFVQEVTVTGASGASHDLDAALLAALEPYDVQHLSHYPSERFVYMAIEFKNRALRATMDTARALVGLAVDLGHRYTPRGARVILVVAHDVTDNAFKMIESYTDGVVTNAAPNQSQAWVASLGRRLRVCR